MLVVAVFASSLFSSGDAQCDGKKLSYHKKALFSVLINSCTGVYEMLQPVLDEINTGLTDIRGNLTRLESKIGFLSDQVEERNNTKDLDCSKSHISLRVLNNSLMQALADVKESIVNDELSRGSVELQLSAMNASITEELAAVESLVEAHNTSVVSRLDGQTTDHEIIHSSLDTLNSEHDAIDAKLMTITSDLESV